MFSSNLQNVTTTILDVLTPDDIRILTETLNEDSRKGNFIRVFPSADSHKYNRFFEQPRYYNILVDQWIERYQLMESEGRLTYQFLKEEKVLETVLVSYCSISHYQD